MCVIIIKQTDKQLSKTILRTSSRINPHGLGIVWLDTYETTYHKSSDWKKLVTNRPFIAHFRFATKGKINKANTHPFVCGKNKHELLMHNGTIPNIGTDAQSDSRMLSMIQDLLLSIQELEPFRYTTKNFGLSKAMCGTVKTMLSRITLWPCTVH